MEKFTLLFETEVSLHIREGVERDIGPDWILRRMGMCIGYADDFDKIFSIIDEVYKSPEIPFIAVVNNHNSCFIYKAEGDFDEIIRVSLPRVLKMYEAMEGEEIILADVKDVRDMFS